MSGITRRAFGGLLAAFGLGRLLPHRVEKHPAKNVRRVDMRYPNGSSISVPFNGDRQVCFTEAGEVWLDGSVRDLKGMDRERFLSGTWADKS